MAFRRKPHPIILISGTERDRIIHTPRLCSNDASFNRLFSKKYHATISLRREYLERLTGAWDSSSVPCKLILPDPSTTRSTLMDASKRLPPRFGRGIFISGLKNILQ